MLQRHPVAEHLQKLLHLRNNIDRFQNKSDNKTVNNTYKTYFTVRYTKHRNKYVDGIYRHVIEITKYMVI